MALIYEKNVGGIQRIILVGISSNVQSLLSMNYGCSTLWKWHSDGRLFLIGTSQVMISNLVQAAVMVLKLVYTFYV